MNMFWVAARTLQKAAENASTPHAASTSASASSSSSGSAGDLERLELVCEAMWILLKEKLDVTDDQLMSRIAELDLSDGFADGKKRPNGPKMCPKCNRPNSPRHDFCLYCGQLIRTTSFQ